MLITHSRLLPYVELDYNSQEIHKKSKTWDTLFSISELEKSNFKYVQSSMQKYIWRMQTFRPIRNMLSDNNLQGKRDAFSTFFGSLKEFSSVRLPDLSTVFVDPENCMELGSKPSTRILRLT